jgi:hypothetical protein
VLPVRYSPVDSPARVLEQLRPVARGPLAVRDSHLDLVEHHSPVEFLPWVQAVAELLVVVRLPVAPRDSRLDLVVHHSPVELSLQVLALRLEAGRLPAVGLGLLHSAADHCGREEWCPVDSHLLVLTLQPAVARLLVPERSL